MTVAAKALAFDVFGTVVDWRGSIIKMGPVLHVPMIDQWATHVAAMRADGLPATSKQASCSPITPTLIWIASSWSPEMANAKRGGRNKNRNRNSQLLSREIDKP